MIRGFIIAVRILTSIPIPGREPASKASALPWFPVVGALLGASLCALSRLLDVAGLAGWVGGEAFALVALGVVLTRGLHLDGLADWADGFFSMTDRKRTLEIMKDSQVGTFGVLALISALGLKWIAVVRLIETDQLRSIIAAYIVSRLVMAELAVSWPYARAEGGTGASIITGARRMHGILGWLVSALLLTLIGPFTAAVLIPAYVGAKLLGHLFKRRVGGVTGDLLGASSEMVETILLALFASCGTCLETLPRWELLS